MSVKLWALKVGELRPLGDDVLLLLAARCAMRVERRVRLHRDVGRDPRRRHGARGREFGVTPAALRTLAPLWSAGKPHWVP